MLSYGDALYIYGKRGNLQQKIEGADTTYYTYDNLGNLTKVALPDGTLIEYIIDGQNRRIAKKVNGAIVKRWIYQDQLNPVAELDNDGNITARFVYGTKLNVPDYIIKNDSTYRIISDHLGSVRLVVNIQSNYLAQRLDYDEYGNELINTNSDFQPFGFAGGLYEEKTGLVRFGARDYDAGTGRWTNKDPILFAGGVSNLYEYCLNDPVNKFDIDGLQQCTLQNIKDFLEFAKEAYESSNIIKENKEIIEYYSNLSTNDNVNMALERYNFKLRTIKLFMDAGQSIFPKNLVEVFRILESIKKDLEKEQQKCKCQGK